MASLHSSVNLHIVRLRLRVFERNNFASKVNTMLSPKKLWNNIRHIGVSGNKNTNKCVVDPGEINNFFLGSITEEFFNLTDRRTTEIVVVNSVRYIKSREDGCPCNLLT